MLFNINVSNNDILEITDFSKWEHVNTEEKTIYYNYIVDQPEEKELTQVAEYPNGGKDYQEVVKKPEVGHFSVTYENGDVFPYDVDVPDGISKDVSVPDIATLSYWRMLSEEEISELEEEASEAAVEAEKREAFLNDGPSRMDTLETTQDDIVLFLADMVGGAS